MQSSPSKSIVPNFRAAPSGVRSITGMTLLEVAIALAVFTIATIGFIVGYTMMNKHATALRCETVADAILRAKVAKVLTDTWIVQTVPTDCVVTSGEQQTTADPNDPYDTGPTVTLLSASDSPQTGFITGTLYRNTRVLESTGNTVVVDYRLTYVCRGITYNRYASVVRARDQ